MKTTQIGIMLVPEMKDFISEINDLVDYYQLPSDNYYNSLELKNIDNLLSLSKTKPIHIHSVDLSLASDNDYDILLDRINELNSITPIITFSDHIGFSKQDGLWTGLPIINAPFSNESADIIIKNIKKIKEKCPGIEILIENNSRCITWPDNNMTEGEFYNKICTDSGAKMLLDITNMLADAKNFNFNIVEHIKTINSDNIKMIDVAGGDWMDGFSESKITRGHFKKVDTETFSILDKVIGLTRPDFITLERSREVKKDEIISDIISIKKLIT